MAAVSDSTFFSSDVDAPNRSMQEWKLRFPTRPNVYVKVASIITPAKFWVYEVPLVKTTSQVETRLERVADIEKSLKVLYNDVIPKAEPDGYIKDLKADTMVAVRPSYRYVYLFLVCKRLFDLFNLQIQALVSRTNPYCCVPTRGHGQSVFDRLRTHPGKRQF